MAALVGEQSEGGQFIWVAPSGGRDRPDPATGKFVVSPYDPKSVEVFRLMASKARGRDGEGPVTHFFPFAMWTNKLVPPPEKVILVGMKVPARGSRVDDVAEGEDGGSALLMDALVPLRRDMPSLFQ